MEKDEKIKKRLEQALSECARLREENARLRMLLNIGTDETVNSPHHDLPLS
jgi:cell shape-determining protein MreC